MTIAKQSILTCIVMVATSALAQDSNFTKPLYEVSGLVQKFHLNDPQNQKAWNGAVGQFEKVVPKLESPHAFVASMNRLLVRFGLPEGALAHRTDQNYWLFNKQDDGSDKNLQAKFFGARFERRGHHWYVLDVFPGGPAAQAQLVAGDEIIALNGKAFRPVVITNAKNDNQKYEILFRRDPSEKPKTVSLEPAPLDFTTGYIRLMQQESRVDVIDSQNIGYLRLPGMRKDFLNTFKNSWQKLGSKLDALVLDFRRGLPGRDSGFLPLFFTDPDASNHLPLPDTVTILIDEGTQEGLEWIAALLRKEKKVHLIGSASAGQLRESTSLTLKSGPYRLQVLKGDPDELRGLIPDQPLQPDYLVEAPLVYAHGVDEVRRKAIQKTAEWAGK